MIQRLILCCSSKCEKHEGTAKASLNRANNWQHKIDPKRDELAVARVNSREIEREARTGGLFKTLG
jgi:hypothetical protein